MRTRKNCQGPNDIPKEEHYAIIFGTSVYIPGDQRSIDYPGHGYPASTNYYPEYVSYTDKQEWMDEIIKLQAENAEGKYSKKDFVAMKVTPAKIETTVKVNIS